MTEFCHFEVNELTRSRGVFATSFLEIVGFHLGRARIQHYCRRSEALRLRPAIALALLDDSQRRVHPNALRVQLVNSMTEFCRFGIIDPTAIRLASSSGFRISPVDFAISIGEKNVQVRFAYS